MPTRATQWSIGMAIVIAGIAFGSLAMRMAPDMGGEYTALTSPAVAKYDAQNGTTLLVATCFYCENQTGFLVEGDHSSIQGRVHLRATDADAWRLIAVEPTPVNRTGRTVTQAHAGPFEVVSPAPRLAAVAAAPTLVVLGAATLARPPREAALAAAAALAGALAILLPPIFGEGGIAVFIYGFPLALLLTIGFAIPGRTRRLWPLPFLMWGSAIWTLFKASSYFPGVSAI